MQCDMRLRNAGETRTRLGECGVYMSSYPDGDERVLGA